MLPPLRRPCHHRVPCLLASSAAGRVQRWLEQYGYQVLLWSLVESDARQRAGGPGGDSLDALWIHVSDRFPTPIASRKKVRKRWAIPAEALAVLHATYLLDKLPSCATRNELAERLKVTPRQITVWFQNKRQRSVGGLEVEPTMLQEEAFVTEQDDFRSPPIMHNTPPVGDTYHAPLPIIPLPPTSAAKARGSTAVGCLSDGVADAMAALPWVADAMNEIDDFEQIFGPSLDFVHIMQDASRSALT